jgi:GAF domain-containing protein
VLGTFAMYYGKPRLPSAEHIQLIDMAVQMARVAIEAKRRDEALRLAQASLREVIDTIPAVVWSATIFNRRVARQDRSLTCVVARLPRRNPRYRHAQRHALLYEAMKATIQAPMLSPRGLILLRRYR